MSVSPDVEWPVIPAL
nr:hypothetical protein [Escherichia coli]